MKTILPQRTLAASCMLAVVGALFVVKYSMRLGDIGWIAGVVYAAFFVALILFLSRLLTTAALGTESRRRVLDALMGLALLCAFLVVIITPETSRVGRMPAIVEWIDHVRAGTFPWGPETVTNPSGFPVLFLLAAPFHAIGNLGLLEVAGILLFAIAMLKISRSPEESIVQLAGLLALPTFYYELLVRSELLFNMALVVIVLVIAERYPDRERVDWRFITVAALLGFALSTRAIVGIIIAAYLCYRFRSNIKQGVVFAFLVALAFALTLLPFILWDAERFLAFGPFSVQGRFLPTPLVLLALLAAIIGGWKARDFHTLLFIIGTLLFIIVFIAAAFSLINDGIRSMLFNNQFDISYFIFCVPFLLLSMQLRNQQPTTPPTPIT